VTPVHRLHGRTLALAIGLALALAAIVGIVLAIGNAPPRPPELPGATRQNGPLALAAAAPPLLAGALGGRAGAAGGPAGGPGGAGSVTTGTIALSPPGGWVVLQTTRMSVALEDPRRLGLLVLLSGALSGSPSEDRFAQSLVNSTTQGTTDARICGTITTTTVPNGPEGLLVPLCYTLVPQNGKALQLYAIIFAGVSGKVGTVVRLVTPARPSTLEAFAEESAPLLSTVQWRLLS